MINFLDALYSTYALLVTKRRRQLGVVRAKNKTSIQRLLTLPNPKWRGGRGVVYLVYDVSLVVVCWTRFTPHNKVTYTTLH